MNSRCSENDAVVFDMPAQGIYTCCCQEDIRREAMVHFVGAGPGAPDLITVRGKKLIEEADVII